MAGTMKTAAPVRKRTTTPPPAPNVQAQLDSLTKRVEKLETWRRNGTDLIALTTPDPDDEQAAPAPVPDARAH